MRYFLLLLLLLPLIGYSAQRIYWVQPIVDTAGNANFAPITGYELRCSQINSVKATDRMAWKGTGLSTDLPVLPTGNWFCAIFAINSVGHSPPTASLIPLTCDGLKCLAGTPAPVCAGVTTCPTSPVTTVAPRTGYTDRPLYSDATRTKTIGRVEVGLPCEAEILIATSSGSWRWTSNTAGLRGVSLCR